MPVANEETTLFTFLKMGYGAYDVNTLLHTNYQRWTNMTTDFSLVEPDRAVPGPADLYTSTPGIRVHKIQNNLDLKEEPQKIDLPQNSFTLALAAELLSPLQVKVFLVSIDPADMTTVQNIYTVYHGQMQRAVKQEGSTPRVRLFCVSDKKFMDRPMGIPAHDGCSNIFGGPLCRAFLPSFQAAASVVQINGQEIIVTGPGVTSPPFTDYWRYGSVEFDGLVIGIAEYDQTVNSASLKLHRRAPSTWIGQTITVTAGCNKSRDHCRNRFSNEINYMGLGDFMPSRNVTEEALP